MKRFVAGKCWRRFSSSTSSTSTTMCLKGANRASSRGVRRTDRTWVMFACSRASRRRSVKMLPQWSDNWTVGRQGGGGGGGGSGSGSGNDNDKDDDDDDAAWPCKEGGVIRNHSGRQHYVPANVQIEVSGNSVEEGHYGSSQRGETRK